MIDPTNSSASATARSPYLRILRQTIRRELENELNEHLTKSKSTLDYYLKRVGLDDETVGSTSVTWEKARRLLSGCKPICQWFNLDKFLDDVKGCYHQVLEEGEFLALRRSLMVRLHGFWLFTLDDTSHTFRFVPAAREHDEWGLGPLRTSGAGDKTLIDWAEPSIHFGDGVFYKKGAGRGNDNLRTILQGFFDGYLLRPGEGSVGLGLRADRGVCLRNTVRDLRGAVA